LIAVSLNGASRHVMLGEETTTKVEWRFDFSGIEQFGGVKLSALT